ncbi:hypothetical protein ACI79C_22565 [Geodermatophilus sp. SYSU D00697]
MPTGLLLEDGDLYASAWSIAGLLGQPARGELVRVGEDAFAPRGVVHYLREDRTCRALPWRRR